MIRAVLPVWIGEGGNLRTGDCRLPDVPVQALDRHMEGLPGPIHLSPLRDKIKREYGNIDSTFIRDRCRDLALRAWNRRKITRMMDRENDPEPETSGRGSWTESWIAGC